VAAAIVADWGRLFVLVRGANSSATPVSRWQFQTSYPTFPQWVKVNRAGDIVVGIQYKPGRPFHFSVLRPADGGKAQVDRPIATFLRSYQLDGGYTPGPLFAFCALAGIAGSVAALTRRWRGPDGGATTMAILLFTVTGATLLLLPDVYEFTWRYQLPAVITLPPAGALAVSAFIARQRARRSAGRGAGSAGSEASGQGQCNPGGLEDVLGGPGASAHAGGESSGQ